MCPETDQTVAELDDGTVGPMASVAETAFALNVSMQHVRRLIEDGELSAYNVGLRRANRTNYKIPVAEIRRFLADRARKT